ncbi:MAG TPA: hypothetical protein PLZ64_08960 [Chitinophagales bacterium]|nr:hypothetical protein [Chitinophagales bacterium]
MKNKILIYGIVITVFVVIVISVFNFIVLPKTAPYKNLIRILKEDAIIYNSVGEFKKIDQFPSTNVEYNDSSGFGEFWVWVYGTKGKSDIYIKIVNNNGIWEKDSLVINKVILK